jgi:hypothetical protein
MAIRDPKLSLGRKRQSLASPSICIDPDILAIVTSFNGSQDSLEYQAQESEEMSSRPPFDQIPGLTTKGLSSHPPRERKGLDDLLVDLIPIGN